MFYSLIEATFWLRVGQKTPLAGVYASNLVLINVEGFIYLFIIYCFLLGHQVLSCKC